MLTVAPIIALSGLIVSGLVADNASQCAQKEHTVFSAIVWRRTICYSPLPWMDPVLMDTLFRLRPRGGVVTCRTANPFTPVRFRAWPPTFPNQMQRRTRCRPKARAAQAVSVSDAALAFWAALASLRRPYQTSSRRRIRRTRHESTDRTSRPSGIIQKPIIGRKPSMPRNTKTTPRAMRTGFEPGTA